MLDVVTVGETMVAFIPNDKEKIRYANTFGKKVAGAESNVAIGIAKLGFKSGWISKVGKDEFGEFVIHELRGEGVDTSCVVHTDQYPTGLMFKQFSFGSDTNVYYYRKNSAASHLSYDDIDENYIRNAKILHLTGITPALSHSCQEMIERLVDFAKKNKVLISFDPNIRLKLWSKEQACDCLLQILKQCDIALLNQKEAQILLGLCDTDAIIDQLRSFGTQKIAVKCGSDGAVVADSTHTFVCPPIEVPVIDNIGAGDAFNSGFLCGILENKSIQEAGVMGSFMGAMAVSSYGDTEGLPNREQLKNYMNHTPQIHR